VGWRASTRRWASRFWDDLKASTDASLLGLLRFVGLLYGRIDHRIPIDQAFRKSLHYRLPRHTGWRQAFGGITYLLLMVLVVTGVLLSFYYRPSAEEAYQSVQHVVSGIRMGWLMRDLHVWAANLIVVAMLVHMSQVFFSAAYKPPRETNWLVGVLMLFTVLAFGATGYLLPWDQGSYWTVTEGLDVTGRAPVVGGFLASVLRGDPIVSGATLSRFFALHVIVLPWLALGLLMLHFGLVRKHGAAPRVGEPEGPRDPEDGIPFFPNHLLRSLSVAILVMAIATTAAVLYPRPVGDPANPAQPPEVLLSTWIVADVSRAMAYYTDGWGPTAFVLLALLLVLLPLFDRKPERAARRRPVMTGLGVIFLAGLTVAWVAGWRLRFEPVSASGELTPYQQQPAATPQGAPLPPLLPTRGVPEPGPAPDTASPGGGA
jgi:quinol-cytochrome oxidoreductase complex cytochrome b subunit